MQFVGQKIPLRRDFFCLSVGADNTLLYFCFVVIRLVWLIVQCPSRVSARQPNSFLLRGKKEPKKRAPFPGPAGYPSFAASARPVAKLATLKQRDWNSRAETTKLGGSAGEAGGCLA